MSQKDINRGINITFADGEVRLIKPLTIRSLRKFMKVVSAMDITKTQLEDEDIDRMVEAATIVFEDNKLKTEEDIEDLVDIKSFNELFSAAMGADPNV